MFGLVELEYRGGGCQVTLNFFFIFYLVRLWLGFIPKISFLACLEVPKKFVWWWWWFRVNSVIAFGLALAQPWPSRTKSNIHVNCQEDSRGVQGACWREHHGVLQGEDKGNKWWGELLHIKRWTYVVHSETVLVIHVVQEAHHGVQMDCQ